MRCRLSFAETSGLGEFWEAALGAPMGPGVDGVRIAPDGEVGFSLHLVQQRATEHPRNQPRLWLNPVDGRLQDEVDRLTGLGATIVNRYWTNASAGAAVRAFVPVVSRPCLPAQTAHRDDRVGEVENASMTVVRRS